MPILDEIEVFFAGQSNWKRQAYAALRGGSEVNEAFLDELTAECVRNATTADDEGAAQASGPSEVHTREPAVVVRLLCVEHVRNIASLAADQSLTFAPDGLTVIYGDNGAGKTGYERILRQVCRARGAAPALRGNVFVEGQASGSAEVAYSVNAIEARLTVRGTLSADSPLRHFSVFDTGAAASLVNDQNATAFRPFGLDLLDRFSAIADEVQRRIERELTHLSTPCVRVEEFPDRTSAGRFLRELDSTVTAKAIDSHLIPLTAIQEARRKELATTLAQAKVNDPAKLAFTTNARASRYHQLTRRLEAMAVAFSPGKLASFITLRLEAIETEKAAEVARTKAFSNEPLNEVGTLTWRRLWDAARNYSVLARAGRPLTDTRQGELCLLCAQPLDDTAADRIRTLEAFVTEELQERAKNCAEQFREAFDALNNQPIQQPGDDALLQELTADDATSATSVRQFLARARKVTLLLQTHHATGEATAAEMAMPPVPVGLVDVSSTLRQHAVELQRSAMASTLASQENELAELDTHMRLAQIASQVRDEAVRLARRRDLERAKRSTSTRGVSELSRDLTVKYVSDALCNRFRAELASLGLDHLEGDLTSTGAHKGQLFHRITLKAKQDAPLQEVVSEGEFRCLALAAFLAEIGGSTSGILFDDPVSSLDHTWRKRIAIRLAEEARKRQVIIFTHDIAFHFLLREAAESPALKVPLSERCVERRGKAGAGFCRDQAPWAGMKTKARIGMLKNDIVALKKQYEAGEPMYERDIRDWYGRLRESWERAIEECLLKDSIRRFSHSVRTNSLKEALAKIKPDDDWAAIEKGMTRASAAIRGHDGAAELNPPIPTPTDATQDLVDLETWVKTKN